MSDTASNHANGKAGAAAADNPLLRTDVDINEKVAKLRELGWEDRVKFNYETISSGAAPEYDATRDDCEWLGNAAVYAWDDEYGEVGPVDGKLEQELFFGENLMKAGTQIQALSFTVDVMAAKELKEKLQPVREVICPKPCVCVAANFDRSSRTLVFTLSCSRMSPSAVTTSRRPSRLTPFRLFCRATMWWASPRLVCSSWSLLMLC